MKIYLASSWKNEEMVDALSGLLKSEGHKVDAFTDSSKGRYVFHFSEIGEPEELNAVTFLHDPRSQKAFKEDRKWIDWCECLILILPAGKSSHLEAGYAKGKGKKLIIFSPFGFPKGQFDVMYGFADYLIVDIGQLFCALGRDNDSEG